MPSSGSREPNPLTTCVLLSPRDLKLDNTLLTDDNPPLIKLCDFGFSREWQADVPMHTHIGYDSVLF